jgi:hypothetical protein
MSSAAPNVAALTSRHPAFEFLLGYVTLTRSLASPATALQLDVFLLGTYVASTRSVASPTTALQLDVFLLAYVTLPRSLAPPATALQLDVFLL